MSGVNEHNGLKPAGLGALIPELRPLVWELGALVLEIRRLVLEIRALVFNIVASIIESHRWFSET